MFIFVILTIVLLAITVNINNNLIVIGKGLERILYERKMANPEGMGQEELVKEESNGRGQTS